MYQRSFDIFGIMNTTTVGANIELSKYAVRPSFQKLDNSSFNTNTCKFCYFSRTNKTLSLASRKVEGKKNFKSEIECVGSTDYVESKEEEGLTYKDAGVDIDAGSELVRRIAKMAPGIGGFGGLFPLGMSIFASFIPFFYMN